MEAKPILVFQVGNKAPASGMHRGGDYGEWIAAGLKPYPSVIVDPRPAPADTLARICPARQVHRKFAGVVISGSRSMVTDAEPWSVALGRWLVREAIGRVPVLGICYGHQLLANALGGLVENNRRGRRVGTVSIRLTQAGLKDPMLSAISESAKAVVHLSHTQHVRDLPKGATRLAVADHDENHAFVYGDKCWGVQFHPEFDWLTVRDFIRLRWEILEKAGYPWRRWFEEVEKTNAGSALLQRFSGICQVKGEGGA